VAEESIQNPLNNSDITQHRIFYDYSQPVNNRDKFVHKHEADF